MSQDLNNSHLLLIATYHDLVPTFKVILRNENYNLKRFYLAVEQFGQLDKEKRNAQMQGIKQLAKKDN